MTEARKQKSAAPDADALPSDGQVAQFLRRNPDFFERYPDLLTALSPPARSFNRTRRGAEVIDFQQAMLARMREDLGEHQRRQKDLVTASRTTLHTQARVHDTALKLLSCRTLEHLIEVLTTDLTVILELDTAALCVESGDVPRVAGTGIRVVPTGLVDDLLPNPARALARPNGNADRRIYGSGAGLVRSEVLLRIHVRRGAPPALLALGAREPTRFRAGQSTEPYGFLARVVEHCIRSWIDAPR